MCTICSFQSKVFQWEPHADHDPLLLLCCVSEQPGSTVVLLLVALGAITVSAQPIPKAVSLPPYPLSLKLSVKREGDKAVGTATITNPTKETVQVCRD
jgi:hypothetical protein